MGCPVSKGTCQDFKICIGFGCLLVCVCIYIYSMMGMQNSKHLITYEYYQYYNILVCVELCRYNMYDCQCCDMAKGKLGAFQNPRVKDTFWVLSLLGYSYNFKGCRLDCIATTAGCCDLKDFSSAVPSIGQLKRVAKLVGMMLSSCVYIYVYLYKIISFFLVVIG